MLDANKGILYFFWLWLRRHCWEVLQWAYTSQTQRLFSLFQAHARFIAYHGHRTLSFTNVISKKGLSTWVSMIIEVHYFCIIFYPQRTQAKHGELLNQIEGRITGISTEVSGHTRDLNTLQNSEVLQRASENGASTGTRFPIIIICCLFYGCLISLPSRLHTKKKNWAVLYMVFQPEVLWHDDIFKFCPFLELFNFRE